MKKQMDVYVPYYENPIYGIIRERNVNRLNIASRIMVNKRMSESRVIDLRSQSNKVFEILAKSKR